MAGNHYLVHLALLLAEPISWAIFNKSFCDESVISNGSHRLLSDDDYFFQDYFRDLQEEALEEPETTSDAISIDTVTASA